jgi:hypothetical protein
VTSVATESCPESTTALLCSVAEQASYQDVERRLMLLYSIADHRLATRDRFDGAARLYYLQQAEQEIRMALDGASIETILEARQ